MHPLPSGTSLGDLRIIQVYDYYDGPRLFSCTNVAGTLYLVLWHDETTEGDAWLYVPVSETRLQQITSGAIDLHTAFAAPEDGWVYDVFVPRDGGTPQITCQPAAAIGIDHLPYPGDRLAVDWKASSDEKPPIDVRAQQARRELVDFAVKPPDDDGGEVTIELVGEALMQLQRLVYGIVIRVLAQRQVNAQRRRQAIEESRLVAIGSFKGSFGVHISATQAPDMLGQSVVGDGLDALADLLKASDDQEALKVRLSRLKPRVAAAYRDFLALFEKKRAGFSFDWGSTLMGRGYSTEFDSRRVVAASRLLRERIHEIEDTYSVVGVLIGANVRTRTFEIHDTRLDLKYAGAITDEGMQTARRATLNQAYTATIRESVESHVGLGRRAVSYSLLKLEPVAEPQ